MKLKDIKKSYDIRPNYYLIPVYKTRDPDEYNALLDEVRALKGFKEVKFTRTQSRGISVSHKDLWYNMPGYELRSSKSGAEILILSFEFGHCRIQFRPAGNKEAAENKVHGAQAFKKFKDDCDKYGIDLESYMLDEESGYEVKMTIEKPHIGVFSNLFLNNTYENVHHLDINSSYPAGLAESHPEFRKLIERYYRLRKQNSDYKAILNLTIGFMQSPYCSFRYSQLSRDAIAVNNRKVEEMTLYLQKHDRIVLAWNTDGIWFQGESLLDKFHSTELGEWHQDYSNCKFRMKSAGAYEFICDGQYYPRVRGKTTYETIKPREEWTWGDIYNASDEIIKYVIDKDGYAKQVIEEEEK